MHPERRVNQIGKRLKTGHELSMISQIGDYDMDYIILDLGSDVNILTRQNWESMGKSRLVCSLFHLILENQLKVLRIDRPNQVPIEI